MNGSVVCGDFHAGDKVMCVAFPGADDLVSTDFPRSDKVECAEFPGGDEMKIEVNALQIKSESLFSWNIRDK